MCPKLYRHLAISFCCHLKFDGNCVVVAVSTPAHTGFQIMISQELTPLLAGECDPWSECMMTFSVGLRLQTAINRAFKASEVCMRKFIDYPMTLREYRSMTANQIQPALMSSGIGDISKPNRVQRINAKVLLQLVSRHDSGLGAILTRTAFITDLGP